MMRKPISRGLLASLLLTLATAGIAKPSGLVETDLPVTVLSSGAFSQQFTFSTAQTYSAAFGSIYASGLSSNFSNLSLSLFDSTGAALTGPIASQTFAQSGGQNIVKSTFADSAYGFDLNPNTVYKLVVSGDVLQGNTSFNIHGVYVQSITAAVPEPETYSMMLAGLGLIGAIALRRARKT